jgi:LPS export ABC transporter protein LptC
MIPALFGACEVKTTPPSGQVSQLADSADQIMWPAKFNLTDDGLLRAHVEADTAFFFDENTRVELNGVQADFYTARGVKDGFLTSRHGTTNSRTHTLVARENVLLVAVNGRRLATSELIYDQRENEITSDSSFVLTEPGRRLQGRGFRADPSMTIIQILNEASGLVRAISPRPAPASSTPAAGKKY